VEKERKGGGREKERGGEGGQQTGDVWFDLGWTGRRGKKEKKKKSQSARLGAPAFTPPTRIRSQEGGGEKWGRKRCGGF